MVPVIPIVTTSRLTLTPLSPHDIDKVFDIYRDPATWEHLPTGRHRRREESVALIAAGQRSWTESGAGPWAIRIGRTGSLGNLLPGMFIGTGGVTLTASGLWNLGYRLAPTSWGRGLATEMATAAIMSATTANSTAPVTARALSNNPASCAVAERVGLKLLWEGPTKDTVAAGVRRRIYADREPTAAQLEWLVARA
ncbi:GNAT family N-acetyltransferase [uncultured Arthrobacter sp.]|uniref:GNAT family N-acetyltransferase n=1 Tax=uncultured Arthrobacter sp. TaxID=114050 RepID=UPI002619C230|nr:GNAT family N-acetyltransferase [uncultured Arthrobacter sp.]